MREIFASVVFCLAVSVVLGQQPPAAQSEKPKNPHSDCPMHKTHDDAASSVMNERGEKGMGFSQTATTHRFLLRADGGAIQVEANDSADLASRDNIRMHLSHIATAFANGDFAIPMFVHDTVPPGVAEMKRLRGKIIYTFEETARGGRVLIATTNKESLAAIHAFLRFQIDEHRTGDSMVAP